MSTEQNPVTPAQAATPGSSEQGQSPQSAGIPPTTGTPPEGTVTISTKEFADLQRAKARAAAADQRNALARRQSASNANMSGDPDDQVNQEIARLQQENSMTQKLLLKERVTNKVRNILDKPEYQALPRSTRDLILRNPVLLSEADNEEEAILDIEDYVREQVAIIPPQQNNQNVVSQNNSPKGHETPPTGGSGPAPSQAATLEDTSRLRGDALTLATLRNGFRKAKLN